MFMAVAELRMTSVNVLARNTTWTEKVVVGRRARRATLSVLKVPATREQTMRVGLGEMVTVHACRVEVHLLANPIVIASRAEADIHIRKANGLCRRGARVLNVLLVHRRQKVSVHKKCLASGVTSLRGLGNVQHRIAYVRWRVQAGIPVRSVSLASV